MSEPRVICWFSHGAASAIVAKLARAKYGERAQLVYCDTSRNEHADNLRFRRDIEQWLGCRVTVIGSEKFKTVEEVNDAKQYIAGIKGAPCTVELKKVPRFHFQEADDIHMFGFTADETAPYKTGDRDRIAEFERKNPDMILEWILRDNGITKADCFNILRIAGIELPIRYKQGFLNNNCKACNKATSLKYWVLTRQIDPEDFRIRAEQSRRYGARMVRYGGKRIFLDEIPPDASIPARFLTGSQMEDISCGPECSAGIQMELLNEQK